MKDGDSWVCNVEDQLGFLQCGRTPHVYNMEKHGSKKIANALEPPKSLLQVALHWNSWNTQEWESLAYEMNIVWWLQ